MVADRTPSGFGGMLRDARERRGVSLRQVANATKISVSALEALERNDVSRLPGGIFSRAFVRSYASEVGLDPDATIQEFIAAFPNDAPTAGQSAGVHVDDSVSVDSERRMAGTFLWLVLLSLPIAGAVLYFAAAGRRGHPEATQVNVTTPKPEPVREAAPTPESSSASAAAPPAAAPAAAPPAAVPPAGVPPAAAARAAAPPAAGALPPAVAPEATPPPGAQAATPPVVPAAAEGLTVVLSVKRPCWVSASVDGDRQIERLLQPGERQTIQVQREMTITAGDASAISLTFNGAEAKPLGKTGEVVTARFNLTNFKDYVQAR
jgi:cytoskeletal protein RodZ